MKTLENNRILTESTPFTSYQFGIRSEDLSHIFSVLRNQMYSDKILAVIREYSTNAYDAHVVAGIKNTPIRISLPNTLFPEFKVRDYGHGLSEEDVKNVYALVRL
jgi:HSP90 family molecular chaperone